VLPPWTPGTLDIHQISTGRGNSALVVMPDGTTLLVDAGPGGDVIARYIERTLAPSPARLDYAVLTHFHGDHVGGFDEIVSRAAARAIRCSFSTTPATPHQWWPCTVRISRGSAPSDFLTSVELRRSAIGPAGTKSASERRGGLMRALHVLGRAIFGGFFAYNGINHLQHSRDMAQYAAAKGVPAAEQAVRASGLLLLGGGLSILAGVKPRQGLAAIIAFLIPVSLQMHRFWEAEDAQTRQNEMIHFMKNMALVGAALAMMKIDEPWPASIDAARAEDEEMFVRLGGRDLRALPA
jgi:putative oxidoreductase